MSSDDAQEKSKISSRRAAFWISQAENHIESRRFYLARRILEALHTPESDILLDDLNTIAPPPPAHTCPICGYEEFGWHRTITQTAASNTREYLQVDRREVYSRVCAACSNVQMFLDLPDWARLTSN